MIEVQMWILLLLIFFNVINSFLLVYIWMGRRRNKPSGVWVFNGDSWRLMSPDEDFMINRIVVDSQQDLAKKQIEEFYRYN